VRRFTDCDYAFCFPAQAESFTIQELRTACGIRYRLLTFERPAGHPPGDDQCVVPPAKSASETETWVTVVEMCFDNPSTFAISRVSDFV
jgi:hypothetical protein